MHELHHFGVKTMADNRLRPKDMQAKWPKLNETDLVNVRSHGALSTLIAEGYSLDKTRRTPKLQLG